MFYPSRMYLRILVTLFQPLFCRTSHNLICNKFAILKTKKLTKLLNIGKFEKLTKLSIAELTLVICITNIKTHGWYESYETPFLFRVNLPKLFCSFTVGLNSAFYGTSKFALTFYFCEPLLIIVQESRSLRNIKQ